MQQGTILSNERLHGDYFIISFHAPEVTKTAQGGQFVHIRIGQNMDYILRRPFSIHDADPDTGKLSIVYKVIGKGTLELSKMRQGESCDLMGPLGKAYTPVAPDEIPVFVDGGYGAAATYLIAKNAKNKGVFLLGARSASDVILDDRYEKLGCKVLISTNDGSRGHKGLVTDLIESVIQENSQAKLRFYGCGPHPMLIALAKKMQASNIQGELSLDHLMCCGIGACFACVVKVKSDTPEGWKYARACNEGPIFDAKDIYAGE